MGRDRGTKPIGDKHHYVPKFYLKPWTDDEGRLCEFSRPYDVVKPRMTHPDGTGYQRGLYTFKDLPPVVSDFLEKDFFLRADDCACAVLQIMFQNKITFSTEMKEAWSRFLMTLFHRTPERLDRMRRYFSDQFPVQLEKFRPRYETLRAQHAHGPTFEEFCASLTAGDLRTIELETLHTLMDSELVGNVLMKMHWAVIYVGAHQFPLLTCDRPIMMSDGLGPPDGSLMMPISPTRLFIAAQRQEIIDKASALLTDKTFVPRVNDRIVRQARKYVYGVNDRQLRFVQNRFGSAISWSPFE